MMSIEEIKTSTGDDLLAWYRELLELIQMPYSKENENRKLELEDQIETRRIYRKIELNRRLTYAINCI